MRPIERPATDGECELTNGSQTQGSSTGQRKLKI